MNLRGKKGLGLFFFNGNSKKKTLCEMEILIVKEITYISLLLFKASKTFWYRKVFGVLASCKHR